MNKPELVAKTRAMSVAFRESILEASEEDLKEALRDDGCTLNEEAARVQDVIERAFQQAGVALPAHASKGSEHLGELLSLLRRKRSLTAATLALQAGVPLEDVQRTESDPTFVPSLRT